MPGMRMSLNRMTRMRARQAPQRRLSGPGDVDFMSRDLQDFAQHLGDRALVVDHQYPIARDLARAPRRARLGALLATADRKLHPEERPSLRRLLGADATAMRGDDLPADGQSQPGAGARAPWS